MPLLETNYCIEQINVPPKLPAILKQFCKSAIRTQPYDLLKWSSAYFNALANGEEPPAKLRLEYPPACSAHGLTLGFLKVLLRQLGADYNKCVPVDCVLTRWDYLCLDERDACMVVKIGRFKRRCAIKKFMAIATGLLTRDITETMILICELFTHEPEGGSAMIPLSLFMELYGYLAGLRCDGSERGSQDEVCLCSDATTESSSTSVSVAQHSLGQMDQQEEEELPREASHDSSDQHRSYLKFGISHPDIMSDDFEHEGDTGRPMSFESFADSSSGSFMHEGEASYRSSDFTYKTKTTASQKSFEKEISMKKESEIIESLHSISKKSGPCSDSTLMSSDKDDPYYPDVPGIGSFIPADEVARVAIWMSECGRRQSGMVGPRNIRHINCPPLNGCYCKPQKSCSDLTD